jgi:hypothetical protein
MDVLDRIVELGLAGVIALFWAVAIFALAYALVGLAHFRRGGHRHA